MDKNKQEPMITKQNDQSDDPKEGR